MSGRVRVFCAVSLDGFLAGVDDDLSWLPGPSDDGDDGGFGAFLSEVGALLMGRRTFDVVDAFDGPWPYGERPVRVATHRPLSSTRPQVRAVAGPIHMLVAEARDAAGGADLYVDGGQLVRATLDAGLADAVTITQVPIVLGAGIPLFAGCSVRRRFRTTAVRTLAHGMVQLDLRPDGG